MANFDPEVSTVWPPLEFRPVLDTIRLHSAWYSGSPEALEDEYQRHSPSSRPAQYAGGILGTAARMFWGKPRPVEQARTKLHVPVPADIATVSADLLFSEAPRIIFPDDEDPRVQDRAEEVINTPENHSALLEAAEVSAALSGVYLRLVWDTELSDYVMLDAVHPDQAIPEFKWGRLTSVTFFKEVDRDRGKVLRHLETHRPGEIVHQLWKGEDNDLGRVIPLTEHPATRDLATSVNAEAAIPTGVEGLTATYVPNIRPARRWRNTSFDALGRSDFEGVEGLFDTLDETYSSWIRDVRLAKARLVVPAGYLHNRGRGKGASFDDDQEIFTELNMLAKDGSPGEISAHQFAIRHEEHASTTRNLIRAILRATGYSAQTFGEDLTASYSTATEVAARERASERTRAKKTRYWAGALGPFFRTLLQLDSLIFNTGSGTETIPEIRFPSSVQTDSLQLAQTLSNLKNAEAISTETSVRMLHPDWDADAIDEEVTRIQAEREGTLPDPYEIGRVDMLPEEEEELEEPEDEDSGESDETVTEETGE